jgi:hypothetical protein
MLSSETDAPRSQKSAEEIPELNLNPYDQQALRLRSQLQQARP